MSSPIYYSGQFLLATPGMGDPRFARSVIAICSHDEQGALGINIGDTSDELTFHGILRQFDISTDEVEDELVFLGGPVEPQRGFILHSLDFNRSDTVQVGNKWGLSSSVNILHAIADRKGPNSWKAALGYSGWGAGQLEGELTQNGWMIAPGDPEWIFEKEATDKWETAWKELGIEPSQLSGSFGSA